MDNRVKVILVTKRTSYSRLTEDKAVSSLLNKKDLNKIKKSHQTHQFCVEHIIKTLRDIGVRPNVITSGHPFDDSADLVISIGGDGTLLSASHNITKTPIMGINSDPANSMGYLCCATVDNVDQYIKRHLRNPKTSNVTRMEVMIKNKSVAKRVLNEALFTHSCPAAMTKFKLNNEMWACSGAWIGTGAGSTGAIKSAGGKRLSMLSKSLQCIIRESYFGDGTNKIPKFIENSFKLTSGISDAVIYLDGPFLQIPVGYGDTVTFRVSKESLNLIKYENKNG